MRWTGPVSVRVDGAAGDPRAPLLVSIGRNMLGRVESLAAANPAQSSIADVYQHVDGSSVRVVWTPHVKTIYVQLVGEVGGASIPGVTPPEWYEEFEYFEPLYNGLVVEETETDEQGEEVKVPYLYPEDSEDRLVKYDRVARETGRKRIAWKLPEGHHVLPVQRGDKFDFLAGDNRQLATWEFPLGMYPLTAGKSKAGIKVVSGSSFQSLEQLSPDVSAAAKSTQNGKVVSEYPLGQTPPALYEGTFAGDLYHTRFDDPNPLRPISIKAETRVSDVKHVLGYSLEQRKVVALTNINKVQGYPENRYNNLMRYLASRGYAYGPHWVTEVDLLTKVAERREILGHAVIRVSDASVPTGMTYHFFAMYKTVVPTELQFRLTNYKVTVTGNWVTYNQIAWGTSMFWSIYIADPSNPSLYRERMPTEDYFNCPIGNVFPGDSDSAARTKAKVAYTHHAIPGVPPTGVFIHQIGNNNDDGFINSTLWLRMGRTEVPEQVFPVDVTKQDSTGLYVERAVGGITFSMTVVPAYSSNVNVYVDYDFDTRQGTPRVTIYEKTGEAIIDPATTGTVSYKVEVDIELHGGAVVPVVMQTKYDMSYTGMYTSDWFSYNRYLYFNGDYIAAIRNMVTGDEEAMWMGGTYTSRLNEDSFISVGGETIDLSAYDRRMKLENSLFVNLHGIALDWVATTYADYTLLSLVWMPDKSVPPEGGLPGVGETEDDLAVSMYKLFVAVSFVVPNIAPDKDVHIEGKPESRVLRVKTPEYLTENYGLVDVDADEPAYNDLPDYAIVNPITGEVVPVYLDEEGEPDIKGCFVRHGDAETMFKKLPPGVTGPIRRRKQGP